MDHRTFRPVEAARAMRRLLDDPDATEEAFNVIRHVDGGGIHRLHRRFTASESGQRLLRDRPSLLDALSDTAALAALPEGTLGRAYLQFCEREGITPGGLVEPSVNEDRLALDDERRYIADRMRDSHDLFHVVTGYRTDLAGELSVLAFTTAQTGSIGTAFLVLAAYLHSFSIDEDQLGERARRLARRAFARGLEAQWLPAAEWERLLTLPLDEVRLELGITAVPVYRPRYKADLLAA